MRGSRNPEEIKLGRTEVNAVITGTRGEKEFTFLVDTGSTYVGIPAEDIAELGLIPIPGGRVRLGAPTGIIEQETYGAYGRLAGRGFLATIIATPVPLLGYELLENVRFRVNPVTERLEEVGDDEFAPPFAPWAR